MQTKTLARKLGIACHALHVSFSTGQFIQNSDHKPHPVPCVATKKLSNASQHYKLYSYVLYTVVPTTISIRLYEASSESKKPCNKVVLYTTTSTTILLTVDLTV